MARVSGVRLAPARSNAACLDGRLDSPQRLRISNGAFLHPDHSPARRPKYPRDAFIPPLVFLDFVAPEFLAASRQILAGAPVPEAAVDERGYLETGPSEIRPPLDWPLFPVTA